MKSYRPEELFDDERPAAAGARRAGARRATRRMSANPHANGGLLLRDLRAARLPRLRRRGASARRGDGRGDPRHGQVPARCDEAEHARRGTSASSAPTRTTRTAGRTCSRSPTAPGWPRSCPYDDHLAPDGRVMEMLSEHQCQGWLEGYLLTGRHGFFSCYEAFIHIIDSMFNQHAKWLKVCNAHPLAAADRLAELPAVLPCLAAGPQRLQPSGPGVHRPRRQQEGRGGPRLPAAGRQLPAVGHRPLPAQPQLRQRRRRRQAAGAAVADDGRGGQALHGRARHLGVGQQRPGRRARRGDGLLRRRADAGDAGRGRAAARSTCRS